jgi:hypothetical protein
VRSRKNPASTISNARGANACSLINRLPQAVVDISAQRVHKAECDVGLVAVHDHRDEQAVQGVPDPRIVGERREGLQDSGAVLRDVTAVQTQALAADPDGGVRVHRFERQLRPVRVLAQLGVEIIEDGQDEARRGRDTAVVPRRGELAVGLLELLRCAVHLNRYFSGRLQSR